MPVTLYYYRMSQPTRVIHMALKQLNVEHILKPLDMDNGEQMKPEYLAINPAHCVPTIVDGDLILWESRAILQYLANKYAPDNSIYPTEPKKRAIVDRMLYMDMSLYSSIYKTLITEVLAGIEPSEAELLTLKNNLKLMSTVIGDNKYVTGDQLTIADLTVLISVSVLGIKDFKDLEDVPNIKSWFERVRNELPYYDEVNGGVIEIYKQLLADLQK